MYDPEPDDIHPGSLTEKHAYAFTIGLLHDPPVQDFIDRVRNREGIIPPENADDRDYNLENHPPDNYEAEALEFAMHYIEEPTAADMGKIDPTQTDLKEYIKENPLLITPPGMLEGWIQAVIPTDSLRSQAAKVIARHIVVGYMELPEPIYEMPPAWVMPLLQQDPPVVVMVAGPGCKLDELFDTFKDIYRETFNIGERERGPDKAIKTAWQRGMAKYFRRHPDEGQRVDHRVADLSFEVWPETKPPFDEESDAYYEAMYDEADRFRSNSANYKEWLDEVFGPEEGEET